jgi:hypothetical protein
LAETKAAADQTMVFPSDAELAKLDAIMATVAEAWVKDHPNGQALFAALKEELAKIRAAR